MSNLSVFKTMRIFPRFSIKRIKYFFFGLKWGIQRAVYGYCDMDLLDLDQFYTELFISTLDSFSRWTMGYPQEFENEDETVAINNWKNHIKYVKSLFEDSIRSYKNPFQYYMDNMEMIFDYTDNTIKFKNKLGTEEELEGLRQCYFEEESKINKKKESLKRTALAELADIFSDLWM